MTQPGPGWMTPVTDVTVRAVPEPEPVNEAPAEAVTIPPIEVVTEAEDGTEAFRAVSMVPAAIEKLPAPERLTDPDRAKPSTLIASVPLTACSWLSVRAETSPPRRYAATSSVLYCVQSMDPGRLLA